VTVQDAEEFANRLAQIASPTRYNNSIDSLRAVFAIGIESGILTKNPFAGVGKQKPNAKHLELPSTEAFAAILKTVRAQGAWCSRPVADLIEFLAYTGCRLSEASNVRWEDVDFEREMLTIWATKHARYQNGERRPLPFNASLRNLLINLRDEPRYFRRKEREGYVLAVTECEKTLTQSLSRNRDETNHSS
jgi:integrase